MASDSVTYRNVEEVNARQNTKAGKDRELPPFCEFKAIPHVVRKRPATNQFQQLQKQAKCHQATCVLQLHY
jgi:hypothetical protein